MSPRKAGGIPIVPADAGNSPQIGRAIDENAKTKAPQNYR
jgi:hypothetical protein